MKTYVRFIAFTLSVGISFAVAYLAQIALDTSSEWWAVTVTANKYVPPSTVFKYAIILLRALIIGLSVPSISSRCLRNSVPLLVVLGALDVVWCYAFARLHLIYLCIGINLTQLAVLGVLTAFYLRNTRFIWILTVPVDVAYIAMTALCVTVAI